MQKRIIFPLLSASILWSGLHFRADHTVEHRSERLDCQADEQLKIQAWAFDTVVPEEVMLEEMPVPTPPPPPPVSSDEVHGWVRQPPDFPGAGAPHRFNFIAKNLQYPPEAREKGIEGTVVATFIVEKDGSLSDIKIIKGIGGGCDEEALRLLRSMPKWSPGRTIENVVVRVLYTQPIEFRLKK